MCSAWGSTEGLTSGLRLVYMLDMITARVPLPSLLLRFAVLLLVGLGLERAAVAENWVEVKSAHFTVCTPASEKDGKRIAGQFEQIRALFHTAFPTLRVDPAQPIVILAVKSEKGMKELLPEQWETKNHIHVAGLYQPGYEKHYVILQMDAEGNNPYHTLYHEYTHALLHLNFAQMPLWLDEGLAEYLGNAALGDKESRIGTIDPGHLYILQSNRLLPIETLLAVDHASPYYNESNRASVFYAESWALVHYIMLSPEARQKQLLSHFMEAWDKGGDQLEAARQAFGDLKKFGQLLEAYARQSSFFNAVLKNSLEGTDKNYAARNLAPAEVLALRGDFFVHHNRLDAGKPLLEEAAKQDPKLALPHEGLGYYYYRARDSEKTEEETKLAATLGSASFFTPYLQAVTALRSGYGNEDARKEITANLQKSIHMNANFAPAHDMMATAYSIDSGKMKEAVTECIQAAKLDPTEPEYAVHLTRLLLQSNRDAEAKVMADRFSAAARSPIEKIRAQGLQREVQAHKDAVAAGRTPTVSNGDMQGVFVVEQEAQTDKAQEGQEAGAPVLARRLMIGVEGAIVEADCSKIPEISMTLDGTGGALSYHVADVGRITITAPGNAPPPVCKDWTGRRVKLWFQIAPGSKQPAEVSKLNFQ